MEPAESSKQEPLIRYSTFKPTKRTVLHRQDGSLALHLQEGEVRGPALFNKEAAWLTVTSGLSSWAATALESIVAKLPLLVLFSDSLNRLTSSRHPIVMHYLCYDAWRTLQWISSHIMRIQDSECWRGCLPPLQGFGMSTTPGPERISRHFRS